MTLVFRPLLCAGNKERRRSLYAGCMINITIEPDDGDGDGDSGDGDVTQKCIAPIPRRSIHQMLANSVSAVEF